MHRLQEEIDQSRAVRVARARECRSLRRGPAVSVTDDAGPL